MAEPLRTPTRPSRPAATTAATAACRVAVVYPIPFGPEGLYGGGERYAHELARALSRRVPTRLVTFATRPRRFTEDGLEIRHYRPLFHPRGERSNPFSLRFLGSLADVDLVHCVSWNTLPTDLSIWFAHARGKRAFVTDVGGGASLTLSRRLPIARWVDGFLLIAEKSVEQFGRFRDKARVILAGIDVEHHRPDPGRARRGVLFVGRLLPHKGVDTLIEAMDPDVPLRVVGRPYQPEYFELLQQLAAGKDVTFVTDASDEAVLAEQQSCAVAVLPSVNRTVYGHTSDVPDLLGFTAMEAMATGAPVVCTRVGGLPELVVDGVTGFLVPPSDPPALRVAIRRLIDDPALAARMGAAARARIVERFTWDGVAERCLEAYRA